jgi:hypothetical protein
VGWMVGCSIDKQHLLYAKIGGLLGVIPTFAPHTRLPAKTRSIANQRVQPPKLLLIVLLTDDSFLIL